MRAHPRSWLDRLPRRRVALVGTLLVGAMALGGCSGDAEDAASTNAEPALAAGDSAQRDGGAVAMPTPAPAAPDEAGAPGQQAPIPVQERSLIYTGMITVQVEDVASSADRALGIATGLGGAVAADQRSIDGERSEAQVVLRVPADNFTAALDQLAGLGEEESRSIQTEDVTEALVDVDARLATQRASVDRVRALLAQANTIGEIISIESELTRREADLASLEQRKERLAGLVALSTITANLRGPGAGPAPGEPETGFLAGVKSGWRGFLESVRIVLTAAGWLLPWAITIGLPVWLLVWFLNRRARSAGRPVRPTSTDPPPSAGPPSAGPPTATAQTEI